MARPSRARRGHRRRATGRASAAASCSSPWCSRCCRSSTRACNTLLPAEDRYNLTFEPPRPPGPSAGRLAFAGAAPPPAPAEPPRAFTLRYDFDGLVVFRHAGELTAIFDAAHARKARRVTITG